MSVVKTATTEVAESSVYQQLREHLADLQMTAAGEPLAPFLDRARTERVSAMQVLEELLGVEVEATRARRQHRRLRFARYPVHKTLAAFDFDVQPGVDRRMVAELSASVCHSELAFAAGNRYWSGVPVVAGSSPVSRQALDVISGVSDHASPPCAPHPWGRGM